MQLWLCLWLLLWFWGDLGGADRTVFKDNACCRCCGAYCGNLFSVVEWRVAVARQFPSKTEPELKKLDAEPPQFDRTGLNWALVVVAVQF